MVYKFRNGITFRGVDPQIAGEELERIRKANDGKLLTSDVVQWAAEPDSPLHTCFTWDNERAAQAFRLGEARALIKAVVIVKDEGDRIPRPAFWNVSVTVPPSGDAEDPTNEQYYQSAEVISKNPVEYQSALLIMLRKFSAAQGGLESLRSLAPKRDQMKIEIASSHAKSATQVLTDLTDQS